LSRVSSSTTQEIGRDVPWTQLYLGLSFTTLATLILELSLTRIFSVVFYYHFAFLAISIALFGLGAGGVFSYVISARPGNLYAKLGALGLSASASVIVALLLILFAPGELGYFMLAMVYLASAMPFFFAGTVVSIAIGEAMERVDRAYFWDLAGAAAGCLLLIPFLHLFGGPNTVISAAVLYLVSAAIWFHQAAASGGGGVRRRATAVLLALLLVMLMVVNGKTHVVDVRTAKGQRLPPESFIAWNSFSRIGVVGFPGDWTIVIDGDATTAISPFDWNRGITQEQRWKLLHEGPGFPYILRPEAKTLVIGAGGGYDVARALAGGSRDVTAVEINPIIATTIMRERFAADSHRIYFRPEVHIAPPQDGRAFVRGSSEQYQVIQATLVDTWASTAAGAFALSENNLYTADAFYDYLTHLTPDGLLSFTRWGFDPPRESLRLVSLAMDAFARLGETDPARHVIVVRAYSNAIRAWGALDSVLISRKGFTAADIERARKASAEAGMDVVYAPGDAPVNAFGRLLNAPDPQAFFREYPYDVTPVGDDRPFFFYTVQPRDLWNFVRSASTVSADYKVNRAVPLLFAVMAISVTATLLVLVLPRWLLGARLPKHSGVVAFLAYFLCLGAGYILIQIALIQRFILLLGHPEYALTVIVFSMLVSSGLGSYASKRIVSGEDGRLILVLGAIAALVAALAQVAGPLITMAAAWPIQAKVALTAISIAPAAFLMGMPFPSGLRRLELRHAPSVRWAWSINAASSVLGSAGAIVLAIYLGLRATLFIGSALYLCALAVILATGRRAAEKA
jgi:spermidine synthase